MRLNLRTFVRVIFVLLVFDAPVLASDPPPSPCARTSAKYVFEVEGSDLAALPSVEALGVAYNITTIRQTIAHRLQVAESAVQFRVSGFVLDNAECLGPGPGYHLRLCDQAPERRGVFMAAADVGVNGATILVPYKMGSRQLVFAFKEIPLQDRDASEMQVALHRDAEENCPASPLPPQTSMAIERCGAGSAP